MLPSASQASLHVSPKPRPAQLAVEDVPPEQPLRLPSHEAIANRAYERFLAGGSAHGPDQDDWLLAEKELTEQADGPESLQTSRMSGSPSSPSLR